VYRRDEPVLVRAELFKFCLEELILVVGYRLFIKNQNIGNIIVVDLAGVSRKSPIRPNSTYLFLEVLQHLHSFPFNKIELFQQLFHLCNLLGHRRAAFPIVLI
jgi:hypothetical protein